MTLCALFWKAPISLGPHLPWAETGLEPLSNFPGKMWVPGLSIGRRVGEATLSLCGQRVCD